MGHHVTLDDFGTGYSSLSDLKELPLTTLKIDKSFVRHLQKGEPDVEIVKTIIQLARHLHLHVIAEGIETPEQLAFFKRHGAAELQGYLFSKPLPAHALMDYFSEHPELAGKVKA